jgi:hypothetical protein
MMQAGMATAKRYQELMQQGKSPQEVSKIIAAEQQTMVGSTGSPLLGATANERIFGAPRYYVLAKAEATGRPVRAAAVFEDKILRKTGILFAVPAPTP